MKKLLALLIFTCATQAIAHPAVEANTEHVQTYQYGMELDIAHVISITRHQDDCNPSPATMKYLDSEGRVRVLNYIAAPNDCRAENG